MTLIMSQPPPQPQNDLPFSQRLQQWRGVAGGDNRGRFTQREAADYLGVSLRTYQKWEQGIRTPYGIALNTILSLIDAGSPG